MVYVKTHFKSPSGFIMLMGGKGRKRRRQRQKF